MQSRYAKLEYEFQREQEYERRPVADCKWGNEATCRSKWLSIRQMCHLLVRQSCSWNWSWWMMLITFAGRANGSKIYMFLANKHINTEQRTKRGWGRRLFLKEQHWARIRLVAMRWLDVSVLSSCLQVTWSITALAMNTKRVWPQQ